MVASEAMGSSVVARSSRKALRQGAVDIVMMNSKGWLYDDDDDDDVGILRFL